MSKWNNEKMLQAIQFVNGGGTYAEACRRYTVPCTTLKRRCKSKTNFNGYSRAEAPTIYD